MLYVSQELKVNTRVLIQFFDSSASVPQAALSNLVQNPVRFLLQRLQTILIDEDRKSRNRLVWGRLGSKE